MTRAPSAFRTLARTAVLVAGLLVLLWLATATAISGVLATNAPELTLRWVPWSSVARGTLASTIAATSETPKPATVARARALAQKALDLSPVQAAAARGLALTNLLSGREAEGRAAFTYAERLSRRDLPTQMYWIETSVSHNDIAGALRHYDLAMRTSVESRAMLGDIVIAAAAEPPVAIELARLLRTQPGWLPEFYQRLMGQGQNPATLLYIARALNFDARKPDQASFVAMALNRLVALGGYDQARTLYRQSVGRPDETVRNGGFDLPNPLPPFDWTIASEPTYTGIVETRTGWPHGNVLTVTGTEANDVARQLLLLPPGRYRFDADTANVREEREARPIVKIVCTAQGGTLATLPFAAAGMKPAAMSGSFTVPANCPAQWLAIRNTPSFDPVDNDPWIDRIAVRRSPGP